MSILISVGVLSVTVSNKAMCLLLVLAAALTAGKWAAEAERRGA